MCVCVCACVCVCVCVCVCACEVLTENEESWAEEVGHDHVMVTN